jgi:hypothetical protein
VKCGEIEHSILHSILPPAANRIQFFDIQYFYLTFAFNFADLDPPWCLPGLVLVFPGKKKEAEASRFTEFQVDYLPALWFAYKPGRSLHTPGNPRDTLSRIVARSSPSSQYWELFV